MLKPVESLLCYKRLQVLFPRWFLNYTETSNIFWRRVIEMNLSHFWRLFPVPRKSDECERKNYRADRACIIFNFFNRAVDFSSKTRVVLAILLKEIPPCVLFFLCVCEKKTGHFDKYWKSDFQRRLAFPAMINNEHWKCQFSR